MPRKPAEDPIEPVQPPAPARSKKWSARLPKTLRPEVAAAYLNGTTPNTPNEGPATPYKKPRRSPNAWNPPNEGPASPYKPPRRS